MEEMRSGDENDENGEEMRSGDENDEKGLKTPKAPDLRCCGWYVRPTVNH